MKTIIALIALTVVTLGSTTTSYSQEQLDEVILSNKTTQVYVDDFSTFNKTISSLNNTSFKEILKSTDASQNLVFKTNTISFKINERTYVKSLRQAVNKSDDFSEFISLLESRYPKLHKQISKDEALRDVYYTTRKHTFNGYIADLPSVL